MIHGTYFDGRSAQAHPVTLTIDRDRVQVAGEGVQRDEPFASVTISARIGRTPRLVRFSDDALCEVADIEALDRMLVSAGLGQDRLSQWEQSPRTVSLVAIALVVLAVLAYRYGLPFLARSAANNLPPDTVAALSENALATLDATVFDRTEVTGWRIDEVRHRFSRLHFPPARSPVPLQLEFRSSDIVGPNAMALPSGVIVVTDDLVLMAKTDEQLMAVIAHEAGHVQERHGLRNIIQSSVMSILVTWYVGDITGLAAAAPTALLEAKYSRDLEREADAYAVRTLAMNGLPGGVLADILELMDTERTNPNSRYGAALSYLGSHPPTAERIEQLRRD